MTVDDRLAYIKRKQLCFNCFVSSHQFRDCTSDHNCPTCKDRHHTLLHRNSSPTTPPIPSDPPRPVSASVLHTISEQKVPPKNTPSECWVLYPALGVRRTRGTKSYQCRVCQNIHLLRKSHHFLRISPQNRLQEVQIQKY